MTIHNGKFIASASVLACALLLQTTPANAKTLVTGVDPAAAPMAMQKLDGSLEGMNIDMGQALAEELGDSIKIEATQFSAIIPGVNSGKYDFSLAPTIATEKRAESMLFSEGYYNVDYLFVQKKQSESIESLDDLKGKTILVNSGTAYEAWAKDNKQKYGFDYQVFGSNADAIQAIQAGRGDAALFDNVAASWAAKKNSALKTSYTIETGLVFALGFRQSDQEGRDRVSNALKCLKKRGLIAELSEKWLGVTPKEGSPAVTIVEGEGVPGLPGYDSTPASYTCRD